MTLTPIVDMDVRDEIVKHLKEVEDRPLTWLAKHTGINYNTLYSILKEKVIKLSADNKAKINQVLGTDF